MQLLSTLLLSAALFLAVDAKKNLVGSSRKAVSDVEALRTYTFQNFLADHHLTLSDAEVSQRQAVFEAEKARVMAHNQDEKKGWKEALNRFSLLTKEEKQAFFGRNKHAANAYKKSLKAKDASAAWPQKDMKMKPVDQLPRHVDWRQQGESFV